MEVVEKVKSVGQDTVAVLVQLAEALSKAKQSNIAPSEDASVLESLNLVMERIKTFKALVEECKAANSNFVKTRQDPLESIQLNYNELLSRIQQDLEKIEMDNEDIKRRLKGLSSWSSIKVEHLMESASTLALTTHAPPGWDQSAPIWPYRPPYPTEDLIRSSHLFSLMASFGSTVDGEPGSSVITNDPHVRKALSPIKHSDALNNDEEEDQEMLLRGLDIASL